MENKIIEGDEMHPTVNLNADNKLMQITGISRPENPKVYFSSTFEWIRNYFDEFNHQELTVEMTLEYFNTASSKILLDILELMEAYTEKGKIFISFGVMRKMTMSYLRQERSFLT